MTQSPVNVSKFLSYVLRHKPDAIGLELDAEGWASIDELVRLSQHSAQPLSRELVLEAVRTSDKQRFRLSDCGTRVRANQGHSVAVDLGLSPQSPPATLYHGTATRFLAAIRREGLRRGTRHHVHLSTTPDVAARVGQRHGAPVVLAIEAERMAQAGHAFFVSDNGVWLTDAVPVEFIAFPDSAGGRD